MGYNAPSGANWSYGIWKLDLIDTERDYSMSHTLKENFGGDSRLRRKVSEELGHNILETKGVYTSTGTPKITGIGGMLDAEGEEVFEIIKEFLSDK